MNQFDRLVEKGLQQLRENLTGEGQAPAEVAELSDLVEELSLSGLLGILLASNEDEQPRGGTLIDAAAAKVAKDARVAGADLDAEDVARILREFLLKRKSPEIPADWGNRDKLIGTAVNELASRSGVAITPAQARRVAELLASGEFFGDAASVTSAVLTRVPGIPVALIGDVIRLPHRLPRLLVAVGKDVSGTPFNAVVVVADLLDGKIEDPPRTMTHTLAYLYRFASARSAVEMVRSLLAKDNETVRLAVVIYARSHGIPIKESDVDVLLDSALNPENPDLGPALVAAFERLGKNVPSSELKSILRRMAA